MTDTTDKLAQELRELFVAWLESRPSFRTTVEVQAAWEGWKANAAVAAMLAAHSAQGVGDGIDWKHIANEWADEATNGPTYVRNVRDGIQTAEELIEGMNANFQRIRALAAPTKETP